MSTEQWARVRAAGLGVVIHTPIGGGASRGWVCADQLERFFTELNAAMEVMHAPDISHDAEVLLDVRADAP